MCPFHTGRGQLNTCATGSALFRLSHLAPTRYLMTLRSSGRRSTAFCPGTCASTLRRGSRPTSTQGKRPLGRRRTLPPSSQPHARRCRYCTTGKVYTYAMSTAPVADPMHRHRVWHIPYPGLDVDAMKDASQVFVGLHDFTHFSNKPSGGRKHQDRWKSLWRVDLTARGSSVAVEVEGSGFLYKMVRHIVGALVAVGRGRLSQSSLQKALSGDPDSLLESGRPWHIAPAHGLTLEEVQYPDHSDPSSLMFPELPHDEHGRLLPDSFEQAARARDGE
mmetsp:Transcript_31631/g.75162  ORF Transcript_31631/g.75162 Transcript_31631/m.75162 type:complete len:276 (-) Transcript_31631:133-960(-)